MCGDESEEKEDKFQDEAENGEGTRGTAASKQVRIPEPAAEI